MDTKSGKKKISLIVGLNTVITILCKTHVLGAEADDIAKAIAILVDAVHALEEDKKKREAKADDNRDEQKQGTRGQMDLGADAGAGQGDDGAGG